MRYYAVFDTNVLISSLLTKHPDAAMVRGINAIADGVIIPLYNQEIMQEYDEVLHRPKFPFSETRIQKLLAMIRQFGLAVNPYPSGEILPDMDDLVFYEVALSRRDADSQLIPSCTVLKSFA